MTEAQKTHPTATVRSGIGTNGGWLGYVWSERGIVGIFLSFADGPDGAVLLVQLDSSGQPIDEADAPLEFGEPVINWVPIGVDCALAISVPSGAHIGPTTRYEQRLAVLTSPSTLTKVPAPSIGGIPKLSYVALPGGRVGVLAAGQEELVWTVVESDRSASARVLPRIERKVSDPVAYVDTDGAPWVVYSDDFRQVFATRHENGVWADEHPLTRRFGSKQELSGPEVLVGTAGPFVVYRRHNGRLRALEREFLLEAVPWAATSSTPLRVLQDREVSRWGTAQGCDRALLVWESGFSKRQRAVSAATLKGPTEVSPPLRLDIPFPSLIVPFDHHAVLLASSEGILLSKRVDLEA